MHLVDAHPSSLLHPSFFARTGHGGGEGKLIHGRFSRDIDNTTQILLYECIGEGEGKSDGGRERERSCVSDWTGIKTFRSPDDRSYR
jgi:hypothetical protein